MHRNRTLPLLAAVVTAILLTLIPVTAGSTRDVARKANPHRRATWMWRGRAP